MRIAFTWNYCESRIPMQVLEHRAYQVRSHQLFLDGLVEPDEGRCDALVGLILPTPVCSK